MAQPGVTPGAVFEFHAARAKVGGWPGNNTDPTSTIHDGSGNGNDGTLNNFAYTTASGWDGTGTLADPYWLVLDGTDDYVLLPDIGGPGTGFTLEAWVMNPAAATGVYIGEGNSASDTPYIYLGQTSDRTTRLRWVDGAGNDTSLYGAELSATGPHHVIATWDGANAVSLTVDDGTPATDTWTKGATTINRAALGCRIRTGVSYHLNGGLLVARKYDVALDATARGVNYDAGYLWTPESSVTPPSSVVRPHYGRRAA